MCFHQSRYVRSISVSDAFEKLHIFNFVPLPPTSQLMRVIFALLAKSLLSELWLSNSYPSRVVYTEHQRERERNKQQNKQPTTEKLNAHLIRAPVRFQHLQICATLKLSRKITLTLIKNCLPFLLPLGSSLRPMCFKAGTLSKT